MSFKNQETGLFFLVLTFYFFNHFPGGGKLKTIHIGEALGSGRGLGRVGSVFLSVIAGRVGSGQRFAGSGGVLDT